MESIDIHMYEQTGEAKDHQILYSLLLFQLRLSLSLSQFIVNRFFFQFQLGFLASVPAMLKPLRQFGLSVGNLQIVDKLFGNLY